MAVVPMQKVQLLVHHSDVDVALAIIQSAGALEFRETQILETDAPSLVFSQSTLLPRIQHAISFLSPYEVKIGLWKALREGTQVELSEDAVTKILHDTDAITTVVNDLERLQVEFAEKNEAVRLLQEQYDLLQNWKSLPIKLSQFSTATTETKLISLTREVKAGKTLAVLLSEALQEQTLAYALTEVSPTQVALTIPKDIYTQGTIVQILDTINAVFVEKPKGIETPDVEFVAVSDQLTNAKSAVALLFDQAEHFAISYLKTLQIAAEVLTWAKERHAVLDTAAATKQTVIFTGWLNAQKREKIENDFSNKKIAAAFADIEAAPDEEPPVDIVNNKWVQPFEMVTRLYGMPGYKDLDPTLFLAGFFFLFFGLSLTDVGYGLSLVFVSAFLLFFCKISDGMKVMARLLLYIGSATVIVGMLFGGYLGFDPSLLPEPLQKLQLFDPIGNPLPVFYLALGLGVFQVMVGMMLKIYSDARNGNLVEGILDQGPWLLMFFIGIFYLVTTLGYVDIVSTDVIGNLALVAAALIVIAGGRHKGGIVSKIISSAAALYAGVAHFSDILSYSRLLALGLATSALAFAVNLIAGMVAGVPYVGFILAAAILIVGHLFTLAINTLGAFVHSARLQFVEFFGKFIAGTGKEFAPLMRKEKYIAINDE